jgi:hypothetical protein
VFNNYRVRANRKGLSFKLTESQFASVAVMPCHYCGVTASRNDNGFRFNGVDRKRTHLGYSVKNSVPCCSECNYAKRTLTERRFLELVRRIYEHRLA